MRRGVLWRLIWVYNVSSDLLSEYLWYIRNIVSDKLKTILISKVLSLNNDYRRDDKSMFRVIPLGLPSFAEDIVQAACWICFHRRIVVIITVC